jgi:hypothetical protein
MESEMGKNGLALGVDVMMVHGSFSPDLSSFTLILPFGNKVIS